MGSLPGKDVASSEYWDAPEWRRRRVLFPQAGLSFRLVFDISSEVDQVRKQS